MGFRALLRHGGGRPAVSGPSWVVAEIDGCLGDLALLYHSLFVKCIVDLTLTFLFYVPCAKCEYYVTLSLGFGAINIFELN